MKSGKCDERILTIRPNTVTLALHQTTLQCPPQSAPHIYTRRYDHFEFDHGAFIN